jgi:hypothetical protein
LKWQPRFTDGSTSIPSIQPLSVAPKMFGRKRVASERAAEVGRSSDARTQAGDIVRAIFISWENARCIASDDPRLKQ